MTLRDIVVTFLQVWVRNCATLCSLFNSWSHSHLFCFAEIELLPNVVGSFSCCVLANWFGLSWFPGGLSSPSLTSCLFQAVDLLFFHSRVCCGPNGLCVFPFIPIPCLFPSAVYCQHLKTHPLEKAFMSISMGYNVRSIWDDFSWPPQSLNGGDGLCSFSHSSWINNQSCHSHLGRVLHVGGLADASTRATDWHFCLLLKGLLPILLWAFALERQPDSLSPHHKDQTMPDGPSAPSGLLGVWNSL